MIPSPSDQSTPASPRHLSHCPIRGPRAASLADAGGHPHIVSFADAASGLLHAASLHHHPRSLFLIITGATTSFPALCTSSSSYV